MMMKFVCKSRQYLQTCLQKASESAADVSESKPYILTIERQKEGRRDAQNRLSFMWYGERGTQSGNGKEYERNFCKWTFGFPILLRRDEVDISILRIWEILQSVDYEKRIDAMELVEVTRLLTVKEFAEYLTAVERDAHDHGWHLTHPDDLYWQALGVITNRHQRQASAEI